MKKIFISVLLFFLLSNRLLTQTIIPANDPNIQYYGRWDMTDPAGPTHSWPGVYIYAVFQGTSIGIRTDDNFGYYNVFVDSNFVQVFHGNSSGINSYTLRSGLNDGTHTILLTVRGEDSWTKFGFYGFILDAGKSLLPPPPRLARKIEFIGDSYTCASGNEWIDASAAPNDSYTNIYLGFGPLIARHYNAQYQMTSRGGIGLVLDWQGSYSNNLPSVFDRTLFYTGEPKWIFSQWIPNLVVICLGLNDYNGWNGYNVPISDENALLYRTKYHDFIATVMGEYPGANILAVAPNGLDWLKKNISQVAAEENTMGHTNVHYASFPYYDGGYVNAGHPTVATHQKIADTLIYAMNAINVWTPYHGTVAPKVTQVPASGFTIYDTTYVLNVTTDSYATMRYSTKDKPYDQMENTFTTTGKRSHSVTLSGRQGSQNKYYMRGQDIYGNVMDTSAALQFTVDTTKALVRWTAAAYDHSHWKTGKSPLGSLTDSSVATHVSAVKTVYYHCTFTISGYDRINSFTLKITGHDGMVVFLNGNEYTRINVSGDPLTSTTLALQSMQVNQPLWLISESGLLHEGVNTVAVEVHTASSSAPSTLFNASLQDDIGMFHFSTGSLWSYDDSGQMPSDLIISKPNVGVTEKPAVLPSRTKLYANYPNPFNPATTFKFDLNTKTRVRLSVFNMLGQEIAVVVNEQKEAGSYSIQFNAARLASGVYFYRIETESFFETRKMLLMK